MRSQETEGVQMSSYISKGPAYDVDRAIQNVLLLLDNTKCTHQHTDMYTVSAERRL